MSYPRTLQEAVLFYADPENCLATTIAFRWPGGITCPHCGCPEVGFLSTRRIWKCRFNECRRQFSAKVGTIFEDSPLGLDKWYIAMWMLLNCKNGVSSWELHRAIGVTQKTAWFMLHRLRLVTQPEEDETPFSGTVEADETFIGGKAKNMHRHQRELKIQGRGAVGKAIVFGLLERGSKDAKEQGKQSRVKVKVIPNTRKKTIQPEIRATVEPGANVYSDSLKSYEGMSDYVHDQVDHAVEYVRGSVHTNGMENFWSLLKRCLNGTYVSVEAEHLRRYIDEQAFRFNERHGKDEDRFRVGGSRIAGHRLTYKKLIARPEGTPPRRGG